MALSGGRVEVAVSSGRCRGGRVEMAVVDVAVVNVAAWSVWLCGPGPHPPAEGRDVAPSMWWTRGVSTWQRWGVRDGVNVAASSWSLSRWWWRRSYGCVARAHIPQRREGAAGPWWESVSGGGVVVELKGE